MDKPLPLRALMLLSVAAGAAAAPVAVPTAGQGVVAVSVTANSTHLPALQQLSVRRADGAPGPSYRLERAARGAGRDTALFAGALPVGTYVFAGAFDAGGAQALSLADNAINALGRFTVKPRQATDLGRIVVTAMNEKTLFGRSTRVTSNLALLRRYGGRQARMFGPAVAGGWAAPHDAADNVEQYAQVRPVGASCVSALPDGRAFAASRLGSVLQRSARGHWRAVHGSALEALNCVLPVELPGTSLIAVGELGTLLRLAPGGDSLLPVDAGDLPPGDLLYVAGNARAGWYVLHRLGARLSIYHSRTLDAGHWMALHATDMAGDGADGTQGLWMWRSDTGMVYASAQGTIVELDFASGVCLTRMAPARLADFAADGPGAFGVLAAGDGAAAMSGDGALTWQALQGPPSAMRSAPRRAAGGALLVAAAQQDGNGLYASKGRASWQHLGDFSPESSLTIVPGGPLLELHLGRTGLFYIRASADGGLSWRTEYSNFDRQAAEDDQHAAKDAGQ
jgi:hypothetical protein